MQAHRLPSASFTVQFMVCALAVVSLLYLPLPILSHLAQTYQLSPTLSGYTLGAFGFAYALGFLVFGTLSDRLGRKSVMVGGLLALATISVGLTAASTAVPFLVGRAMQGLAAASSLPVALACLAERGTPRQRVWGVAWMGTAFLSAGLLGQIYGRTVAGRWGFGAALLRSSAIYVFTAIRILVVPGDAQRNRLGLSLWAGYLPMSSLLKSPQLPSRRS